ncbi:MAG: ABC transporter ATP-binding protein [Candidatus Harrisonbacteria bacterium CG10_big_fil_rev_8_21_14_0_10_49_15]|uniref:ABC transporter ATP-binding protein n=1 Tax=Candidatus Harrisonbacteria bacterium CG10_big_fil_rev_8_21_14_0_10_49_15 TaxID=1974587 RepID=A0A2H0UK96_9BACT|nr:MAG: ABC transporter ATP-binding protein [Candidatus Harrisonbacteria bacterium CG10_big_fil_rev_8_21_14_0_10_49_15]
MNNIIEVKNLTKKFNGLTAVDDISFAVNKGEIFGFLGPNGAGKSTTINMLSTILPVTDGEAFINEFSILSQRNDVRKSIGLVFQDPSLDDRLTAEENLRFHAKLYGVPKEEYKKRMEEVLYLVDLWDRKEGIIKTFSGGMKRRLEIARGLIHYPAVLFLDEPTIGLDPQTRAHLWDYILRLKREKEMTIFMTTHYMNEAEYCDRIAIIDHGKIVASGTPRELKKQVGGDVISMMSGQKMELKKEFEERYKKEVKEKDGSLRVEVEDGEKFLPRLFNELTAKIDSIELHKPTLDDVFLSLTGRAIREEKASDKEHMRQHMKMRRRT